MRARFEAKIAAALTRIGVRPGATILLALSGGPDSVALLHALLALRERLGYRLAAAHFNHHIRAAESDRDEAFVRDLCARCGIEIAVGHADGLSGANLEERARELRYDFLRRAADSLSADHIALAHHAGDQAETVLLRLLRGSGIAGLRAMSEAGPDRLIRPLLMIDRTEIMTYLGAIGARYVIDSSNSDSAILRNRVRTELIPAIERDYAPGFGRRLAELATEAHALDELLDELAEAELARALAPDGSLDLARLAALHPAVAPAMLRAFVRRRVGNLRRFERAHIEAIRRLCVDGPPNGTVDLPGGWRAEREYARLRLVERVAHQPAPFLVPLNSEGTTTIPQSAYAFEASIVAARSVPMPATLDEALFDADRVAPGLAVRNFHRGDRIRPLGIDGERKVKDVFIDRKVPRPDRASFPLVTLGDEVVWIPGLVRSRAALLTTATTRALRLKVVTLR